MANAKGFPYLIVKSHGLVHVTCRDCGRKSTFSENALPEEWCCVHCEGLTTASDSCSCAE